MIVAWQFTAWIRKRMSPSRRDGLISLVLMWPHLAIKTREAQSYRPYGTGPFSNLSQAVNCQATIDQSLRDEDIRVLG
jgi:hypothetical protein